MAEENDKTGRDEALNEDASTPETADDATDETPAAEAPAKAGKFDRLTQEEGGVRKLTGMYKNWFLDYASYVILERAVPHVEDGLKPVQRRILHAMKVVDDGRYNKVANLDNFVSLLYYFGMLTISGTYKGKTKLTIPNQVVREQIYTYLLSTYNEAELNFSSYEKNELASTLAYDGDWKAYFGYIADCLKRYTSQRDKQKGEFFVHGFTLAMTAQNRFYRPISEQDTQAGYVDIFLCPLLDIYSDMKHSYIVELKYAKYKDPESRVEELRQEAIAQANHYADTDTVKRAVGTTQLHKIVVVYKGMDMPICEEV